MIDTQSLCQFSQLCGQSRQHALHLLQQEVSPTLH